MNKYEFEHPHRVLRCPQVYDVNASIYIWNQQALQLMMMVDIQWCEYVSIPGNLLV
jgi:hypothetical protein|tara:strand:+ start:256 stop:423 length:168 start_codon:yes stop_codon:yes gene_type:complete